MLALLDSLGDSETSSGGSADVGDSAQPSDFDPGPLDPASNVLPLEEPGVPVEFDWESVTRFLDEQQTTMALARDVAVMLPTVSVEVRGIEAWGYKEVAQVSAELVDERRRANISVRLTPIPELRAGTRRPKFVIRVAGQRFDQLINSHGVAIFRGIPLPDLSFDDIDLLWLPPKMM